MRLQTTGSGTNGVLGQGFTSIAFMVDVAERKFSEALAKKKQENKKSRLD